MSGVRNAVYDETGLARRMQAGDSMLVGAKPVIISADAVDTITASEVAGGAIIYTGLTAGRNLTVDTGANLAATFPSMDIGDAVFLDISITTAFAGTFVAATGVTLKGRATCPASSHVHVYVVKTGAATFDWVVI